MTRFAIWIFLCLVLTALPALAEKKVALVIGNSEYTHAKPLPNPTRDAAAMAKMLAGAGFTVISGSDLSRQGMADKIREFAAKAEDADTVLYFYAGHGIQLDGQNYLIPVDADLNNEMDVKLNTLDIDLMLQQTPATARVRLVLLDACRDNPFKEQIARSLSKTRSITLGNGLAEMKPGFGTLIAYATGPGEVALDGTSANSPFTTALLKYLPEPGLEIGQAMTRVRAAVYEATQNRQLPWENKNLTRDYYLVPSVAVSDPDAAASIEVKPAVLIEEPKPEKSWTEDNAEIVLWQAVKDSTDPAELQAYLDKYGEAGIFAAAARKRIASLTAKEAAEPSFGQDGQSAAVAKKPVPKASATTAAKKPVRKAEPKPVARKIASKAAPKLAKKRKAAPQLAEKPIKKKKATAYAEPAPVTQRPPVATPSLGLILGRRGGIGLSLGF